MTEHSPEYNRIMTARKQREKERRRKVGIALLALFGFIVLIGAAMLVVKVLIVKEHNKAVDYYNQTNWNTVEPIEGGYSIYGMSEGRSYSYIDDGRFFEGVAVEGVSIGGMTFTEARQMVMGIIENKLNSISMVVKVGNATLSLSAQDFNIKVNAGDVLDKAYNLGRENLNDFYANYVKQQELVNDPVNFSLEYTCDRSSIMRRVEAIADFVNTDPVEPHITISQRPVVNTSDCEVETVYAGNGQKIAYMCYHYGKNGFVMNKENMVDRIVDAFEREDYRCVLSAELEDTAPQKTFEEVRNGIRQITSYTSKFDVSKRNRCRNIQKAAEIINGCEVKPGQEISFNEYVGPRTEAGGWLPAPGIVNGQDYENSPGGGICQVSGTLYNALLQCGPNKIKVTKRQHHSWPSEYVPYGLDATVDTDGPDLKWRNISDTSIFIFTYADLDKGVMYVYIYSAPEEDGSYYETWAETTETIEPDETIIIEQPGWPTGYSEVTVKARKGYTAKAYLRHYAHDGTLIETIYLYTDYYRPVTGVITRGTGDPSWPKPQH